MTPPPITFGDLVRTLRISNSSAYVYRKFKENHVCFKYHSYSAIIPKLIFDNRRDDDQAAAGPRTGRARAFLQNDNCAVERRGDRRGRMGGLGGGGHDDPIPITVVWGTSGTSAPPSDAFRSARVVGLITVQVRRWKIRWRNKLEDVGVGRMLATRDRRTSRGGGGDR